MTKVQKSIILIAAALVLVAAAKLLGLPLTGNATTGLSAPAATVDPIEIMQSAGPLPEQVIDSPI